MPSIDFRPLVLTALGPALAMLSGCASVNHAVREPAHLQTPVKVLLIQSPLAVSPQRLQSVFAAKSKKPLTLASPALLPVAAHSRARALADMRTALGKRSNIVLVKPPLRAKPLIARIQQQKYTTALTPAEAKQLQAETGADAILRFGITDYGLTPKTWRTSYITFEVVSTLAITALIASVGTTVAKGAAGAYLAQETVEETAEGYAGFWALDVVCRPVRIEAKLIRPAPLTILWHDNDTGLADVHLSRLFRNVSAAERNRQLDQSTAYAVNDLVAALSNKLSGKKNVHLPAKLKWER